MPAGSDVQTSGVARSSGGDDIWDPNTWDLTEPPYFIYTPRLLHAFRVDYVDYIYFTQWLWHMKFAKRAAHRKKIAYCYRNTKDYTRNPPLNGSEYLHIAIMRRTGIPPPTDEHRVVDHIDGDTFNCRRANLRWATYSMNSRNVWAARRQGDAFL